MSAIDRVMPITRDLLSGNLASPLLVKLPKADIAYETVIAGITKAYWQLSVPFKPVLCIAPAGMTRLYNYAVHQQCRSRNIPSSLPDGLPTGDFVIVTHDDLRAHQRQLAERDFGLVIVKSVSMRGLLAVVQQDLTSSNIPLQVGLARNSKGGMTRAAEVFAHIEYL